MQAIILALLLSLQHWSYPGRLDNYLQTTHKVNVSGMTLSQMLTLHDSIHEREKGQPKVAPKLTRPTRVFNRPLRSILRR